MNWNNAVDSQMKNRLDKLELILDELTNPVPNRINIINLLKELRGA